MKKLFRIFAIALTGISVICMAGCGKDKPVDETIAVSSISLKQETATLTVGGKLTLEATVLPENATNKKVTWKSGDETVATVKDGVVTAVTAGEATITVTTEDGNFTAACEISVNNAIVSVTGVTVTPTEKELLIRETVQLTATVEPGDADNKAVSWTSSNEAVATVEDGLVTSVAAGEAIITVTTEDGNLTASCNITVIKEAVVYVAGYEVSRDVAYAMLWTDGVGKRLTTKESEANTVIVSEDNVYVGGYWSETIDHVRYTYATIWKNGVEEKIGGTGFSNIRALYVSGNDVYAGGAEGIQLGRGYSNYPVVWKNGVAQKLAEKGEVYAIFASGGDVYAVGNVFDDNNVMRATLWKNGEPQMLSEKSAQAHSVYVSGTDVYVSGLEMERSDSGTAYYGFLWKNGVYSRFENSNRANCVYVSEDDVYVGGAVSIDEWGSGSARIWKNGVIQQLSDTYSYVYGVAVSQGDVYAVGQDDTDADNYCATVWKNGVRQKLGSSSSFAFSIAVQ